MSNKDSQTTQALAPWHQPLWARIQAARAEQRLPHALLLAGLAGMGKVQFAAYLAQSLLCTQPEANGAPCQRCKACHLFQTGNHPDWQRVEPAEIGKQIRIDQIRELIDAAHLTAHYHGYRILLICPAEAMNDNAANALLKLLEEPPAQTLLLLISHQPMALLATLRSRCQRLEFKRPPEIQTTQWLTEQLDSTAPAPALLLQLSAGAPLAALALAAEFPQRQLLFHSFQQLLQGQEEPVQVAEQWLGVGAEPVLRWLLSWTMDLLRYRAGAPAAALNVDLQAALMSIARQLDSRALLSLLDLQLESRRLLRGSSNVRPQGLLEVVAIAWFREAKRC